MRRAVCGGAAALGLLAAREALAGDAAPTPAAIRAARDAVFARPEFRYTAPRGRSFVEDWFGGLYDFMSSLFEMHPVAYFVGMCLLAALLAVLIAHIVWTLRMARRAEWTVDAGPDLEDALRRGEPGPFRARALEHAAAGRLDEAVRDLYAALLLTLDRRGTVHYASHKALLDYRIEATSDEVAARVLDAFAGTYLPGSFGRRPPVRRRFDELVAALDGLSGSPL